MKTGQSPLGSRVALAILAVLLSVLVFPIKSWAWPGAHTTLQCTDCHLTTPDPDVDTAETVTFVNPDPEELCLGCHATMRYTEVRNSPLTIRHKSSAIVPQAMYEHYLQWIAENGGNYNPPLAANALKMYPSGSDYSYGCSACHVSTGGGYPPIPMTNLELCIACHGGEGNADFAGADSRFSFSPRVLYNPTHLGVRDGSIEYPPPTGAPVSGDNVQGAISLPLTVVRRFHNSVQENMAFRIEIDYLSNGSVDQVVTYFPERASIFTPMRWYTGEPPRWLQEKELHREDTSAWPGGTHSLKIIPYDPLNLIDGNAYAMSLVVAGASCDVTVTGFQALNLAQQPVDTLNTASGDQVKFTGAVTSSQPVDWLIEVVSPYPPENGSGEVIVVSYSGTGPNINTDYWNGVDFTSFLGFVRPGYYLARLTATSGSSCSTQAVAVIAVDPVTVCSMEATVGSSVNLGSGALSFSQDLFSARGGALPVGLELTYRGMNGFAGPVGTNWSHRYDVFTRPSGGDSFVLHGSDGRWKLLVRSGDVYTPRTSAYPILRRNPDGTSILEEKAGLFYRFDAAGRAESLADRNGNALRFSYDPAGHLVSATDLAGRVAGFTYDADGMMMSIVAPDGGTYAFTYAGGLLTGVAAPDGASWTYGYDSSANLISKTDPLGHTARYEYDTSGRLIRSVDPEGNAKAVTYSAGGGLTVLTEKDGGLWTYSYDAHLGVPLSKTDPQGGNTSFVYDSSRNLLSQTDPQSGVTRYTYDGAGNMLTATDAAGQVTTYSYNALNEVATLTDVENRTTIFTYDERGNLTAITDVTGATTRQEYDAAGNAVRRVGALGAVTVSTYDAAGNIASVTDPAGATASFAYDVMGNLTSRTDANGATTTFTYDARGRMVGVAESGGGTISYSNDASGNRVSQTDQNGRTTRYEYDANGRMVRTIDPAGGVTTYAYGGSGCPSCTTGIDRLVSVTDPDGHTTRYEYDMLGRRIAEIDAMGNAVQSTYDANGNLLSRTDAAGRTTRYAYDALSRRTAVTDPLGGVIRTMYSPSGRTASVTDPGGVTTTYTYDDAGRPASTSSPDAGVVVLTYNADGTLHTKNDANGTTITYLYDGAGRLTQQSFPDSAQDISYGYDAPTSENGRGRLTSMTDPSGATLYHYDAQGRVVREVKVILGVSYTTRYQYDLAGNLTATTYPSGRVVNTTLDGRNRPTAVSSTLVSTQTLVSGMTYDLAGNLTAMSLGNGLMPTVSYDGVNRVATSAIPGIASLSYGYDAAGNILSITDIVNAESSKSYGYDPLNRLADAAGPWGELVWSYDANGNRLTQAGTADPVTYSYVDNRVETVLDDVTRLYAYDGAGNTTSDGQRSFVYDQNQRLMQVMINGGLAGRYVYDGKGRRVIKYTGPAALDSSSPQNVVYHYDLAGKLLEETATDGKLLTDYVYLEGRPLAMIRKQSTGEETFYYHDDHLGSPMLMTDKLGKVVWNVALDPFGNVVLYKGRHGAYIRNVVNNLRFPGQYYDAESGLNQNWHRDYDPKLGRYLETDPVPLRSKEMDPFVYVGNRPVIHVDPKGLAVLLETHHVIFGYDHSKVTILPSCQTTWLSDPRFKNRTTSGKVYATVGAGSESGKLVSNVNRPTDVDRTHNLYADLIALPGGIGEDEFIRLLFDTDAKYKDSLDYELRPLSWTDGYNSNSFACGLLKVTTGSVPAQPPDTPGFTKPVPESYFR